jgi:hypothetical protein
MTDLDKPIRQHFMSQQLEPSQVSRILDSVPDAHSPPEARATSTVARIMQWSMAAAVLLAVTVGVHSIGTTSERTEIALREAAMNHATKLNLEFVSEEITELDRDMDQLPFVVSMPGHLDEKFALLGARYCSMRGNLAAHLKLVDRETDKQVSLFMTPMVDEFKRISAERQGVQGVQGVDVRLWHESGMFYALAEAAS